MTFGVDLYRIKHSVKERRKMDFSPLKSFLDELITVQHIPGVDCAVLKDGKEIFRHSAGYSDVATQKKVSPDDMYYIYSTSKVVTCTAGMQLLEKGKFLLNDPLYLYLPEYKEMKKYVPNQKGGFLDTVPAQKPITVGDLFAMTAGLDYENCKAVRKLLEEKPDTYTTREFAAAMAKSVLHFEPGTHWHYSWCHDVLGALIEVVSGQTLGEYMRENIFEPLGMNDTYFRVPEEKSHRLATLYAFSYAEDTFHEIEKKNKFQGGKNFESGGAGLISTVNDYCKFAAAMCNYGTSYDGVKILSKNTLNLMRTNRLDETARKDFLEWTQNAGFGYGLGVRTAINRAEGGYNCADGTFGWAGAAGSYAHIDPESGIVIFYAQHMHNNKEPYVHPRLRNIVYSCL